MKSYLENAVYNLREAQLLGNAEQYAKLDDIIHNLQDFIDDL
jgi:hypothetical protein